MFVDFQILAIDREDIATELFAGVSDLFPICRSITGDGVRRTLSYLDGVTPMQVHEIPSGTEVHDWTVPDEWNIRDAYVKNSSGERVIDFRRSNLHVVNYSRPVAARMPLRALRPHLHTLPDKPDWIPYRTTYYRDDWGFCLSQNQLDALPEDDYEVRIDASLEPGSLTFGEIYLPGDSDEEFLISSHVCHPSLANDNLSGVVVAVHLARHLRERGHRYSYRFLFIPGTIGSVAWLAHNEDVVPRIRHGLVLTCLGDSGGLTYKRSRAGHAPIDRAAQYLLEGGEGNEILEFSPDGYDERQYCSPGYGLPVGRLSRSPHGCFPEYHTSADNLEFIEPMQLADALTDCLTILEMLENDRRFVNQRPKGEPMLSKYGLYPGVSGERDPPVGKMALLWTLNLSDGRHSLLDIAERSGESFRDIAAAAKALLEHGLLAPLED